MADCLQVSVICQFFFVAFCDVQNGENRELRRMVLIIDNGVFNVDPPRLSRWIDMYFGFASRLSLFDFTKDTPVILNAFRQYGPLFYSGLGYKDFRPDYGLSDSGIDAGRIGGDIVPIDLTVRVFRDKLQTRSFSRRVCISFSSK